MWCESLRSRFPSLLGALPHLECSLGWKALIEEMCLTITKYETFWLDNPGYKPVTFVQIKQKFGGLRAYYVGGYIDDSTFTVQVIANVIEEYQNKSYDICCVCGADNQHRGGHRHVCNECSSANNE